MWPTLPSLCACLPALSAHCLPYLHTDTMLPLEPLPCRLVNFGCSFCSLYTTGVRILCFLLTHSPFLLSTSLLVLVPFCCLPFCGDGTLPPTYFLPAPTFSSSFSLLHTPSFHYLSLFQILPFHFTCLLPTHLPLHSWEPSCTPVEHSLLSSPSYLPLFSSRMISHQILILRWTLILVDKCLPGVGTGAEVGIQTPRYSILSGVMSPVVEGVSVSGGVVERQLAVEPHPTLPLLCMPWDSSIIACVPPTQLLFLKYSGIFGHSLSYIHPTTPPLAPTPLFHRFYSAAPATNSSRGMPCSPSLAGPHSSACPLFPLPTSTYKTNVAGKCAVSNWVRQKAEQAESLSIKPGGMGILPLHGQTF